MLLMYFEPGGSFISGIRATYEQGTKGGDYALKPPAAVDFYRIESYECADCHIKDLRPFFERGEEGERLVGLTIELSDGTQQQFGRANPFQSTLVQKEYISNLFGSMGIVDSGDPQFSAVEQLGVEIYE
jgi:hypothetical protein